MGQLVLSRHVGERIILNGTGETVLTVIEIRHDKVRLGFDADKEVVIHREEVALAIKEEERRRNADRDTDRSGG